METDQSGEQSGATGVRKQLEQLVKEIADPHRELQFAAEGLWPARKKSNAAIRRECRLARDDVFEGWDNS